MTRKYTKRYIRNTNTQRYAVIKTQTRVNLCGLSLCRLCTVRSQALLTHDLSQELEALEWAIGRVSGVRDRIRDPATVSVSSPLRRSSASQSDTSALFARGLPSAPLMTMPWGIRSAVLRTHRKRSQWLTNAAQLGSFRRVLLQPTTKRPLRARARPTFSRRSSLRKPAGHDGSHAHKRRG